MDHNSTSGPQLTGRHGQHHDEPYPDEPPPEEPAGFERTPPQDVLAEQCALGGMLLSKDAIADVVEILKTADFYKPAHSIIFDVVCDKYARGEPADPVTVAAALNDSGDLGKIGGAPYLHTLISAVPTAANASYYARIVSERATLRRLIEAGTRIVQLGYGNSAGGGRDVADLVDLAQQSVYDLTERRSGDDFAQLAELLQPTLDEIEAVGEQGGALTGVPTGFADLDRLLNGLQSGQLIIVAGRPGLGKSTAAMDFLRHAALHHQQAAAIFSLEMSKVEIVMRILSAETRVPLHVLRSGSLSDDDWTRLARRMGEISEAPLFVDDTASMTLMEIRAKARRLKQRNDLKLIVVDYLQLMTSAKRVESRQQEVSDMSRGLKLLAKEVECPVIAVAQLNRGPEQRTDKRPQLSDLRESGCVTAGTRVLRADDGGEVTIGELMRSGAEDVPVWALDERLRMVPRTMTHAFPSGRKPTFRLRLASGKQIEATANHRFLTVDGWKPLGELAPGARVATPRRVPEPLRTSRRTDAEVIGLARRLDRPAGESAVPEEVFALPREQVALFLSCLWTENGALRLPDVDGTAHIAYTSPGRRLAEEVMRLLLRCEVHADLHRDAGGWRLEVAGVDDQLRWLRNVGGRGALATPAALCEAELSRNAPSGAVSPRVWNRVRRSVLSPEPVPTPAADATPPQGGALAVVPKPSTGSRLAAVAAVLRQADLALQATNDVYWDEVAAVEPIGERQVYDATVLGVHNFIGASICTHNSLEQDADVVLLLHRDDYYDKESPRAGEADFIVAKQRNGATDTVTVAAQLHLSRFVDMAV